MVVLARGLLIEEKREALHEESRTRNSEGRLLGLLVHQAATGHAYRVGIYSSEGNIPWRLPKMCRTLLWPTSIHAECQSRHNRYSECFTFHAI